MLQLSSIYCRSCLRFRRRCRRCRRCSPRCRRRIIRRNVVFAAAAHQGGSEASHACKYDAYSSGRHSKRSLECLRHGEHALLVRGGGTVQLHITHRVGTSWLEQTIWIGVQSGTLQTRRLLEICGWEAALPLTLPLRELLTSPSATFASTLARVGKSRRTSWSRLWAKSKPAW